MTKTNVQGHRTLLLALLAPMAVTGYAQWNGDTLTITAKEMADVEVVAQRVEQVTTNHVTIQQQALNRDNTGQNLPYLLSTTPALQVSSDDGLGIGYTYFRVRGTDHTRINMTLNDVPLNDAESQTVFWVNMTDMASSMSSIEVQRGVGTSTNGSASFGASLNMSTFQQDTTSHLTLDFNGGMYNTFREMVEGHLVLPNKKWQMNARFSKVNSDGFLYRSASDLYSYFADLGYYGRKTQVVLSVFGGKEKTGMAWNGSDYDHAYGVHGADRRYNSCGEYKDFETGDTCYYNNQTDNYAQQHAQLHVRHRFTPNWSLDATLHYTHGGGYYEMYNEYKDTLWNPFEHTITQQKMNNNFFGAVASAKYVNEHMDVQFGGGANRYIGDTWGEYTFDMDTLGQCQISNPGDEYFRTRGDKTDVNIYGKVNWRIINRAQEKLMLYGDLQYRYIHYSIHGVQENNFLPYDMDKNYHFFNPKAGLTYLNHGHTLYGSFAMANREPTRSTFLEMGCLNEMPRSERLFDYELGYTFSHRIFSVGANLYMMDYRDQLVTYGELNPNTGALKTTNIDRSYRMGIELTGGVKPVKWFRWDGNLVLSRNKIDNSIDLALSPAVTFMSVFQFDYAGFHADVQTGVTGKQYLDNSQNDDLSIKPYTVTNLNLQYSLPVEKWNHGIKGVPGVKILCRINNLFNAKYAASGYVWSDGSTNYAYYSAQAGINVHAGFILHW